MKKTLLTSIFINLIICSGFSQTDAFVLHTVATTAVNPYVIDSGNLNSGVYPDIVVGTYGNTIEIYMNNEDGTFATPIIKTLAEVNGIHIADINGDGNNDILASSYSGDKLVWYSNNGDGTFADEEIISDTVDGPGTIVTGYIDAGSTLDIALSVYGGDSDTDSVIWFANDGLPWTKQYVVPETAGLGCGDIDIADVDGDSDLDIIVSNTDAGTVQLYYNNYNPLTEDNPVSFTVSGAGDISTGNSYLFGLSYGDVNNDTYLDIIKVDMYGYQIAYYLNDGTGAFPTPGIIVASTHPYPTVALCVDFNDDTYNDIVAVDGLNANNDVFWFEGNSSGTLSTETIITNASFHNQIYGLTINDFDNDGDLDLATIGYQDRTLKWIENELNLIGISEYSLENISIYPNPTSNSLNFKGLNETTNVSVYDILGKEILTQTINSNEPLDVSKLQNGIYILKLDHLNTSFKFIKE
jgi:hypothetical protein